MQIIAAIDLIEGQCVRLFQGDYQRRTIYSDDPVGQARRFQKSGFSRVHLVDLEAARSGVGGARPLIARIAEELTIPVQVGGGIRERKDVEALTDAGVEYLILGTVALSSPARVDSWIEKWDPSRFIVSLDLRRGVLQSDGWEKESTISLASMVDRLAAWRVQQVICTDVERDGTLQSPAYDTYDRLRDRLPHSVQLFAAGGVSRPEHILRLKSIGVAGAILGRALYEKTYSWEHFIDAG